MTQPPPQPDACTCPHGMGSGGALYGVRMGREVHRLSTTPGCPEHDACHGWTYQRRAEYASTRPWATERSPYCPIHGGRNCPQERDR